MKIGLDADFVPELNLFAIVGNIVYINYKNEVYFNSKLYIKGLSYETVICNKLIDKL